jgi:hypothetical protein
MPLTSCAAFLALALVAAPVQAPAPAAVPSPEEHLGRPPASDFTLTTWDELSSYYRRLADASPCVQLETIGTSHDGREFLLAVIGSPENLARLGELEARAKRIADPRGLTPEERAALLDEAVPFLFVSVGMHSTECAAWDFGMEFAYRLATSDEEPYASAREKLVIYMPPCLNPDGVDRVAHWYREHVGTPYEGTDLLELYQEYAGHDNNRDWFGLSLQETRVVTNLLYSRVFPQVYWDIHQQGSTRERFFVPGYRDPLNPNLAPQIVLGADLLGTRALYDMTKEGLTGISTGVTYDMWWNGGNRNVTARHNIVGILTEAASCNLGSPTWLPLRSLRAPGDLTAYLPSNRFPVPWPGGWWRLRDIVEYEHAFGRSLLHSLVREPRLWLENTLVSAERAVLRGSTTSPRAYLIPPDDAASGQRTRLLDNLVLLGVEVHRALTPIEADGRTWPAGSVVLRLDQPYGPFVRDLFEGQEYPEGSEPYDVAGWTLPALFGVGSVEIHGEFSGETELAGSIAGAQGEFRSAAEAHGLHDLRDSTSWVRAFAELARGSRVAIARLPGLDAPAFAFGVSVDEVRGTHPDVVVEEIERLPRIGVYAPWNASMNEGWLRSMLDRLAVPYTRVRPEALRQGRIGEFLDVLVLPSLSAGELREGRAAGTVPDLYTRGLSDEGVAALEAFVRGGGRVVALEESAVALVDFLDLPLEERTGLDEAKDFSCPGSVLRTQAAVEGWDAPAVMFAGSRAFAPKAGEGDARATVLVEYAERELLLSGWIRRPETIAGHGWLVDVELGEGRVFLFATQPQYRGWTEHAFLVLLRTFVE